MWRRISNLRGNPDSDDQSISEEEEEEDVALGEMLFPSGKKTKEEGRGLLLQTKLEKLIGGCGGELNHAEETGYVSLEATPRKISSSLEQVPESPEESYLASSTRDGFICISAAQECDEMIHDEPVATWATISKEAKSLLHLNGIASLSSSLRAKRRSKVVKENNVRPKFSFHSHAHGETSSKISDMVGYFEPVDDQAAIEEDPIAECPNSFDEISDNTQDAISNLVVPPPEKIRVTTKRSSKSYSRREVKCSKFAHKGSSRNIQDSDTDDELPGPMDSIGSSTDDEPSYQTSVPDISNQKKQFVGDLFNEAVRASSLNKEGLSFDSPKLSAGSSLHGKLQQMMKQEKEKEVEITKKLQGGNGEADVSSYVDIKIVSRHLEGKLVVCKCSVIDLPGDSLLLKNTQALAAKETETTVIFNPKVCGDVDIEIGCFVRIHAPWKEIEVKNTKEMIIFCSYFSSA
ncbi:unnamed protein product [Eruca vesicaria subsp. sativa]|uniref:Kinetochore protein n=1 Tax=Eruca vesicaria subsp. sativa TaxID=29727 RepID=A0ABC8IWG8_ERUVS|nr:unnamed protein product [Eruca vesicaria subsp. sativa]